MRLGGKQIILNVPPPHTDAHTGGRYIATDAENRSGYPENLGGPEAGL